VKRHIDHIVYCVPDLKDAIDDLYEKTGVLPVAGGRHMTEGTRNALLNLGDGCYLEILAIDVENLRVEAPRWMGIDLITGPRICRWALKTDNAKEDAEILRQYNSQMGEIRPGSRKKSDGTILEWDLVMPLSDPEVELVPFLTDWSRSDAHPTDSLPEACKLIRLEFRHPNPSSVAEILSYFKDDIDLNKGIDESIHIFIDTPKGIVKL